MAGKILVIEDETELVAALKLRLEKEGFSVTTAGDGEEGLSKLEDERPNLIIPDILLPKIDGYEVCRHLKSNEKYKDIPVIMLTVKFQEADKAKGFQVGADEYVTKPFEWEQLLDKVHVLLQEGEE